MGNEENIMVDKQNVRNKIAQTMSHITGAEELFGDFQTIKKLSIKAPENLHQEMLMNAKSKTAVVTGVGHSIVAQPLPAEVAKPVGGACKPIK